jgi:hypothetical protein
MISIPSVDDWYQLTRIYPEYRHHTKTLLKDYGVMACLEFINSQKGGTGNEPLKILEFGHGFNAEVLSKIQDRHEAWGADRDQQLHYFQNLGGLTWEQTFDHNVGALCPNVKFVRELVGDPDSSLPNMYFDLVYSISVLEEVGEGTLKDILTASAQLLKPDGYLFGTHDFCFGNLDRGRAFIDLLRETGYEITCSDDPLDIPMTHLLLEQPTSAMLLYQQGHPEESRKFVGHWGTIFFAARKA